MCLFACTSRTQPQFRGTMRYKTQTVQICVIHPIILTILRILRCYRIFRCYMLYDRKKWLFDERTL